MEREATFNFVAKNGNNIERVYCKISSFRQSLNKLNMLNLFRLWRKDEISFAIVAKNGNNVEATFDSVERTKFYDKLVRHCCHCRAASISYHITELTMALIHQSSVAPYIDNTIVINSARLYVES